jgi:hypothetical protein
VKTTKKDEERAKREADAKRGVDAMEALIDALGIRGDEDKRDQENRPLRVMVEKRYVHVRDDVVALIVERLNAGGESRGNGPIHESPSYRSAMNDAGRGHLLP